MYSEFLLRVFFLRVVFLRGQLSPVEVVPLLGKAAFEIS